MISPPLPSRPNHRHMSGLCYKHTADQADSAIYPSLTHRHTYTQTGIALAMSHLHGYQQGFYQ